jgi:hypothetical protein
VDIVDALSTLAEFSIGLAGFTGIIAIFANSRDSIGGALRFRITNLLALSFIPGFVSLTAIGLLALFDSTELVIRISSFLIVLFVLILLITVYRARGRIPEHERQILNPLAWDFNITISTLNLCAQLYNVLFVRPYSDGILIIGLVSTLLIAAITFCMIIFQIMNAQSTSADSS